ncbi:hypothetical protein FIBSPDRAFT_68587 [Athelia psychrophila]|uniref:Uncharacterized protein n=1 Tax=Athelia psychrophila TaxID=1759441 RepID=A0A166ERL4_9AGAM|nr:hypothetical protein FIBSPDRAFT_68587 [Fibularhizoctonia sp. CBS 109695]
MSVQRVPAVRTHSRRGDGAQGPAQLDPRHGCRKLELKTVPSGRTARMARRRGRMKLATLDVRGLNRASFPALASFLSALSAFEHLRLAFLEDIGADDLEATPIHLQASLKTLHITTPPLASPVLLLPSLLLLSAPRAARTVALTLTLPSLGPAHLRRLPWAKLTPSSSPPSSSTHALTVRVCGRPESILDEISPVLAQPQCLGTLVLFTGSALFRGVGFGA